MEEEYGEYEKYEEYEEYEDYEEEEEEYEEGEIQGEEVKFEAGFEQLKQLYRGIGIGGGGEQQKIRTKKERFLMELSINCKNLENILFDTEECAYINDQAHKILNVDNLNPITFLLGIFVISQKKIIKENFLKLEKIGKMRNNEPYILPNVDAVIIPHLPQTIEECKKIFKKYMKEDIITYADIIRYARWIIENIN